MLSDPNKAIERIRRSVRRLDTENRAGKLALYGREHLVAVRPQGRGIVMYTLHHAAEIRGIESVEELNAVPSQIVNLMEALKKSLNAVSTTKKKPAKAQAAAPAAKRKRA